MKSQESWPQGSENFDKEYENESVDTAVLESEINLAQELEARSIAKSGDYAEIVRLLEEKKLLEEQMRRVKEGMGEEAGEFSFLSPEEWKILTVMELFDKSIFEHGVNTYKIAKGKVEKVLENGIVLARLIEKEGVSLDSFYRACLLHDVGKIEIPSFLIHNTLTERDWLMRLSELACDNEDEDIRRMLSENADMKEGDFANVENLRGALERVHARAVEFVPVKTALSFEEVTELMERGFSPDEPLLKIMEEHEKASERILSEAGLIIEGKLAGEHHNYDKKESDELNMPTSRTSLKISSSLASVMHLADVQEALTKKRPYKENFSKLRMLAILAEQSMDGYIDQYVAYLWIHDELESLTDEEKNIYNAKEYLYAINTLIEKNKDRSPPYEH